MIHIFTALYPEAKPLIQALSLKKRAAQTHYQQFLSEEGDLSLTITGVGPLQAAAVTASVLTDYDAGAQDQLLSLGTAARLTRNEYSERNEDPRAQGAGSVTADAARKDISDERAEENACMYHIHRITDTATKRDFYPDMLLNTGLPEASLITGAKLLTAQDTWAQVDAQRDKKSRQGMTDDAVQDMLADRLAAPLLYDMEAAAIYQAASMFLGPHQMNFLRIVTDDGLTQEEMESGMTMRTVTNVASGSEACRTSAPDTAQAQAAATPATSDPRSLAAHVTDCVEQQVDTIVAVVDKLRVLTAAVAAGHHVLTENERQLVDKLIADAHFSKAMADECVQLIRYAALSELDWQQPIAALYAEGLVPTCDKRAGKIILERYRKQIMEED
ncbi:MAG: hypothetical protein UF438_02500 [Oribacterium sp.]|nr:hypothetical protein [Oribacterium sp.]